MRLSRRCFAASTMLLAASSALSARPVHEVQRHRLIRRADRLFLEAKVNGRVAEALLDSGAEASLVDRRFAAEVGLNAGQAVTARGTGAATVAARMVPNVRIEAAGMTVADATVGIIDLTDIGTRLIGGPLPMIVGREIFDAARLAIDITGRTIAALPATAKPAGIRLPLSEAAGIMHMPVEIEGRPASATFDLGNGTGVMVSARTAETLLADDRATGSTEGGGLGGAKPMRTLTLRSLTLAGRTFVDIPARIDEDETHADANIGVSLLQFFRIVTDFSGRQLFLDRVV